MPDVGTGCSVVFVDSGFTANVLALEWLDINRQPIKRTSFSDSKETYTPCDLSGGGGLAMEVAFNPDNLPPITEDAETVLLRFPDLNYWQATMFVTACEVGAPLEGKMTARLELKATGNVLSSGTGGGGAGPLQGVKTVTDRLQVYTVTDRRTVYAR